MGNWWHAGEPVGTKIVTGEGLLAWDLGSMKSAVQKFVRRGMPEQACAVAAAMAAKGDARSLIRRLPAITVEDAGWQKAWILPRCMEIAKGDEGDTPVEEILKILTFLATGPKDKDAAGLFDVGWLMHRQHKPPPDPAGMPDALRLALREGREEDAVWLSIGSLLALDVNGAKPAWEPLVEVALERCSPEAAEVVQAMQKRANAGVMTADYGFFLGASIEMILHWSDGWIGKDGFEAIVPVKDETLKTLPWFTLDMHTVIGKIAMGSLTKKLGIDRELLDELWFFLESASLNAHRQPMRHWNGGSIVFLEKFGLSLEQAQERWERGVKKDVKGFVEWLRKERKLN